MSRTEYFLHESSYVDEGAIVGEGTQIWHFCHVMTNANIGENCTIGHNVLVAPNVCVGKRVVIENNVSVYTGVTCEDEVYLGPSMVFTNDPNPRSTIIKKLDEYLPTYLKKGAFVGANATLVCGNTIGAYARIAAGGVVTRSVPDYAVMEGNPARHTGWASAFGEPLDFDKKGQSVCQKSGNIYELKEGLVTRIS